MSTWKEFEKAVKAFVAALAPHAVVTHNVKRRDKDIGRLRQYDVWVDAKIGGFFPISMMISCKKMKRKLNSQDLDAFIGELETSGAHKGVLYSCSGFTKPVIEKAKVRGISCCLLLQGQPADIPDKLNFSFYCCCSNKIRISLNKDALLKFGNATFDEVFDFKSDDGTTVLDLLETEFLSEEKRIITDAKNGTFPTSWEASIQIVTQDESSPPLTLTAKGKWQVYYSKQEAHLLKGTYSFTEDTFSGSQVSPWIDRLSSKPGPGWEIIEDPPERLTYGSMLIILQKGGFRSVLEEKYRGTLLKDLGRS